MNPKIKFTMKSTTQKNPLKITFPMTEEFHVGNVMYDLLHSLEFMDNSRAKQSL